MVTPKGRAARSAIVEAAWDLLEQRGLDQLTDGLSVRALAAAADVSVGGVRHHFPTMRDLAEQMVQDLFATMSLEPIVDVELGLRLLVTEGLAPAVRIACQFNWDGLTSPEEEQFYRRFHRVARVACGQGADGAAMRSRLEGVYWDAFRPQVEAMLDMTITSTGRRLVEPFSIHEIAVVAGALIEGLLLESSMRPGDIRNDLYADVMVAFARSVSVPVTRHRSMAEIGAELHLGAPGGRSGTAELVALAQAAAPLFADGYDEVGFAAVLDASSSDLPVESVLGAFGSTRMVAAVSFSRHIADLRAAAERRKSVSVEVALSDVVLAIARTAQAEPWVALALVQERLESAVRSVDDDPDAVSALVPIDEVVAPLLEGVEGRERAVLAATVVDLTLSMAATRPTEALSVLVARVLQIVPDRR